MLRKLPSVALLALGIGLSVTAHPAQGASYAGGASYRICPVPQECSGHTQYQLQRQTVLQNVQETVYDPQQVPVVRTVYETVLQPRTITTVRNVVEQQVRDEPYTVQRAGLSHGSARGPLHRPAAGNPDRLEGRHLYGHPTGAGNALRDPVVHRLSPRQGDVVQDVRLQREPAGARGDVQGRCVHGLPAGPGDRVYKTVSYTVCRPVQETCYKTCAYTVCRPVQSVRYRCVPYTVQVPVQQTIMQCQPATEMVPVRQCAYKQVPYTVCRPVRETAPAGMPLHSPGARSSAPSCGPRTYTVCRPVRETALQECRYTVCKPVQTTTYKTVAKTCYQTVSETAYRESCETVCVPKTVMKPVTPHLQRSGRTALLCARQDGLHQRLPRTVPRHAGAKRRSAARAQSSRTSAARSTNRR